ncbi:LpqB family beta-propeller domain-containing protein [Acrocarpospora macrocephala]|uniref:Lipoprotein LpqB n=1 Tax=Acrocarpospora macrocephala TaxID=150177 RepID=A0A5M3WKW8_9ACTN|nr:LpqB family beta-propeller domain-containing protein [Acrocarpospora macrocephala]GES09296.1 lipoprotein LpqB [Acrocarpospora macrocephala]
MSTRRYLAGLVALGALSACTIVPSSGNPTTVEKEDGGSDPLSQPYVRVIATEPKPDATPVEIVQGFQAAMAGFDDTSRAIARTYLTPEARAKWNPAKANTIICDCKFTPAEVPDPDAKEYAVPITGKQIATIDPEGRYLASPADTENNAWDPISLVKLDGQWRISAAPAALLLRPDDLSRAYRTVTLYYPDLAGQGLVSDRVRLPIDPVRGFPESLIERLLLGPSKPLSDGVRNTFPPGTELRDIRVEDNAVVMDFSAQLGELASAPERLRAVKAQLAWTFTAVAPQMPIVVTVNGEPFPGGAVRFQRGDFGEFDPSVLAKEPPGYYVLDGTLVKETKNNEPPAPVLGAAGEPNQAFHHPAMAELPYGRVAALRPEPGIWVADLAEGSQWQRWISGEGKLTPPSWDRYGEVWSVEKVGPEDALGSRVWRGVNGQAIPVTAPGLETANVKAFRVARDGVRAAVISDHGAGEQVDIGIIVRMGDYRVGGLETLIPPEEGRTILDIAWQDDGTVLVLTEKAKQQSLLVYSISGGDAPDTPTVDNRINSITAAPGTILAADENGALRRWDGTKWNAPVKSGVTYVLYPLG